MTSTADHWALPYIGMPWEAGAKGPDVFDCWGFIVWVNRHHYGRDLPDIPPAAEGNLLALARKFRDHPERKRWHFTDTPKEGDAVLLRQSRHPIHVGIWLDLDGGGVLHCVKGNGVVFQTPQSLQMCAWHIEGYYQFQETE